ncbi:MAG: hypothetical protein QOH68_2995 [Nocardioidaceae bacterium]|jgi:DNA-binding GntR family transcriptional regulator|nr:hypothetical protein [Nocardioidaceae bacterium]
MVESKARASTEDVHGRFRADILGGIYKPGQRLKFAELCERYSASISVLREALTRLAEQGLVTSEPRIGFRVVPLTVDDLDDLTFTRIDIESLALRYSIERGDMAWEAQLVAAHHTLERTEMLTADAPVRVTDAWEKAHVQFHAALVAGCRSARLLTMVESLRHSAELYRRWSQPLELGRDVAAEHRQLMEAALERDADKAVASLASHFGRTAQILKAALASSAEVQGA